MAHPTTRVMNESFRAGRSKAVDLPQVAGSATAWVVPQIRRTVALTPRALRIILMSLGSLVRTVSPERTMRPR